MKTLKNFLLLQSIALGVASFLAIVDFNNPRGENEMIVKIALSIFYALLSFGSFKFYSSIRKTLKK
tara:strand:+ start:236 stop:433 length:198 start_codon:yes stop_codon:yes gene_type:complete